MNLSMRVGALAHGRSASAAPVRRSHPDMVRARGAARIFSPHLEFMPNLLRRLFVPVAVALLLAGCAAQQLHREGQALI